MALLRFSKQPRRDFRPLGVAIVLEAMSLALRRDASTTLPLERLEYARRDRDLLWYLLRGPFWDMYTK